MNDSNPQLELRRLEQLFGEKCNGSLDSEGYAELHGLLAKSPDLRTEYWQMTAVHADLEWDLVGRAHSRHDAMCRLPEALAAATVSLKASEGKSVGLLRRQWWNAAIAAGLAAVLMSGWVLWHLNSSKSPQRVAKTLLNPSDTELAAAQLTSLAPESRWSFGRPGERNPEHFNYGDTVCVEEGMVEMRLDGGTVGELRAPVVLQLLSQNRVRLLTGKIKVNAPARTEGFTVETPSAEVVDLGTVFSVEAAVTGTDLIVYGGKVDLKVPQDGLGDRSAAVTSQQFTAGQAVRVNRNGTLSRIMNVNSSADHFALARPARSHVITSVGDNIARDGVWAFYEIVWGGMCEDTLAFVDRLHEWNGISSAGMPPYLVGGDYVKMFNDDKIADEYKLRVMLSHPATLYVLLDSRVSPPKWLTDSFSDTGDRIGINESHHPGDGPGNNIDRIHSIWKMVVKQEGTIVLGPNGKSALNAPWHINMYGIVAVPLEPVDGSATEATGP
jgi:ferric-dicitrate binding protein FerR (iron transport regulator)